MNKISIVMPAYNAEKYIEESIISVMSQTYETWELLVIDDCSSDDTLKIVDRLQKIDKRIKVYKNEVNTGVSQTRNYGIKMSDGEWVAFLDSDDMWDEKKLEKQIKFSEEVGSDFIFSGAKYINREGREFPGVFEVPKYVDYKNLLKQNVISCSSVLIRRYLISDLEMKNDQTHEDFGFWIQVLKKYNYAHGLNEPLLTYRILNDSKSGNKLKSIVMTFKTYRFANLNFFQSIYYLIWYVIKSYKKYYTIIKEK
ncbi:glycosyltransferase family 2 protein [Exiguobacterium sp. SH5S4]|uniref:glycosyltransferase family 2 protein n=1 Tax=Exiguobacterium sp. SH5S4 TaxID=2510961 RepID=UPI001F2706C7|nr:glycosyltransferase family 2 protein [Exiguobacterium sp. SH5S4]